MIVSDELLAAYHDLYDQWLNETAPADVGVPGYHGITLEEEQALEEAAFRIQHLLSERGTEN